MADLLALARAEQEHAKALLRRRLWGHGATGIIGLLGLVLDEPLVFALPGLAIATEAYAWWTRLLGTGAHERAEEGRRRAVLARELGSDPDCLGSASVKAEFSANARSEAARWVDPDYFSSAEDPGPARLRESLQESAFWSSHLYRAAGRASSVHLGLTTAAIVGALLVVFGIDAGDAGVAAARIVTVLVAAFVASDQLGMAISYFSAAKMSARVVERLDNVQVTSLGQMLAVYGDYSVATAQAAPIPTKLYLREHDAIDEAWRNRSRS